jgi:hypothetical protein
LRPISSFSSSITTDQEASFLNGQTVFTFRALQLFTVRNLAQVLHRVPEINQLLNLFGLQFQSGNQFGNSSPGCSLRRTTSQTACGAIGHKLEN